MEYTLKTKGRKKYSKKELMIEMWKWKLRFHEEKAEECKKQINYLINEWSDD